MTIPNASPENPFFLVKVFYLDGHLELRIIDLDALDETSPDKLVVFGKN